MIISERLQVPPRVDIEITNAQDHLKIDPEVVRSLARRVLEGEGVDAAAISIAFVDDRAIHEINARHLDHHWPTDVITFPLSEPGDDLLEAELVISAEMAATTAREAGTDPDAELALYLVHGLLHLCGYDDRTDEGVRAMRRREDEVLRREGRSNPFLKVGSANPGQEDSSCPA